MKKAIATTDGKTKYIDLTGDEIAARELEVIEEEEKVLLNKYKKLRKGEYCSIEDQLDMIYWDKINDTTTWVDHISTIKNKYPKPS